MSFAALLWFVICRPACSLSCLMSPIYGLRIWGFALNLNTARTAPYLMDILFEKAGINGGNTLHLLNGKVSDIIKGGNSAIFYIPGKGIKGFRDIINIRSYWQY